MKKIKWLVIDNSVEAQIYHIEKKVYSHFKTLTHKSSRLKSSALVSDR